MSDLRHPNTLICANATCNWASVSPRNIEASQASNFNPDNFGIYSELFNCCELKRADVQLLVYEKAVLMVAEPENWPTGVPEVKDTGRIEG